MRKLFLILIVAIGLQLNAQVVLMDAPIDEESQIFDEINSFMDNGLYMSAIKKIETLKQKKQLSHNGYFLLMYNYQKVGDFNKIISTYNDWEKHISVLNNQSDNKNCIQKIYTLYAQALENAGQYRESISAYENSINVDNEDKVFMAMCFRSISSNYKKLELYYQSEDYIDRSINLLLGLLDISLDDMVSIGDKYIDNQTYGNLLLSIMEKGMLLTEQNLSDGLYYFALAAVAGDEIALELFNNLGEDYHKYLKKK